ncbi:MAG: DinB family protein [Cyclobacteriaceae bacterium]|nr:DinB family protein [Cyclobacteriaceae bacterium]MDH5248119.1 DinB family protein [Cyclobacteriaceae bacterium]
MENEVKNIHDLLQRTFEKNAWHGPAVKEVLENITSRQSQHRLPGSHSIAELVAHMTAWRIFVIKKLGGDVHYKVAEEMNFPVPADWSVAVEELNRSQLKLLEAILAFDDSRLHEVVPHISYNYSFYTLLHGIIHHDLYHAGQIALIKKQTF